MAQRSGEIPWYVAGLAFECAGCGGCCAGPVEGYVWVTAKEIAAIAGRLGISEKEMYRLHVRKVSGRYSLLERPDTRDCEFLKPLGQGKRGCAIYEVRPTQCRTWPFWSLNVDEPEDWADAGMRCPGINRGPVFTVKQIQERRNATRE